MESKKIVGKGESALADEYGGAAASTAPTQFPGLLPPSYVEEVSGDEEEEEAGEAGGSRQVVVPVAHKFFLGLPIEMWHLILDEVKDPQDAWNLFKALPVLEQAYQDRKHRFLLEEILPMLTAGAGWIRKRDVLNCRVSCKSWCISVDAYLEEKFRFKTYHPELTPPAELDRDFLAYLRERERFGKDRLSGPVKQLASFFPPMENHLSLELDVDSPSLSASLTHDYRDHLRQLHVTLNWPVETCYFPNLTELIVEKQIGKFNSAKGVRDIVSAIQAPNLVKLVMNMCDVEADVENPTCFSVEEDMFSWMRQFPKLRLLDVFANMPFTNSLEEKGTLNPEKDSIPSLRFLNMCDYYSLSYRFLLCLPSLQHLQLDVGVAELKPVDLSNEPVLKIRDQIQSGNIYDSNVWELLPNLRTITLILKGWNYESYSHSTYSRERWEYLKREGLPLADPTRVRQDIKGFLDNWRF